MTEEEMRREDQVNAEFNTDSLGAVRAMESIDAEEPVEQTTEETEEQTAESVEETPQESQTEEQQVEQSDDLLLQKNTRRQF